MTLQLSSFIQEQSLSQVSLFKTLKHDELASIAALCAWHQCAPQREVVRHQDASHDVFFICQGSVRVTIFSAAGKEVTFQELGAGEIFGELSAIDGGKRNANVMALEQCLLASMPPVAFRQVLHRYPAVADATLARLSTLVRLLCERIFEFSTLGVKNRIHAELLRLANQAGLRDGRHVIESAPTHAELAARVSTHREAVSRELSELKKQGVIIQQSKKMEIIDFDRLRSMVETVQC